MIKYRYCFKSYFFLLRSLKMAALVELLIGGKNTATFSLLLCSYRESNLVITIDFEWEDSSFEPFYVSPLLGSMLFSSLSNSSSGRSSFYGYESLFPSDISSSDNLPSFIVSSLLIFWFCLLILKCWSNLSRLKALQRYIPIYRSLAEVKGTSILVWGSTKNPLEASMV